MWEIQNENKKEMISRGHAANTRKMPYYTMVHALLESQPVDQFGIFSLFPALPQQPSWLGPDVSCSGKPSQTSLRFSSLL
jgi:hypothetical protein